MCELGRDDVDQDMHRVSHPSPLVFIFRARGLLQEEKTMQSAIHGGFLCLLDLIAQLFHYR